MLLLKWEKSREPVWSRDYMGFSIGVKSMPRKPKRPCSYPGCPELVEGRYCQAHQKEVNQSYEKYDRNPLSRQHYGRAWCKIRNRYIQAHPWCVECLKHEKMTVASEVDHILPLSCGGTHDEANLQSLCKSCHSRKSAKEGSRWRKRG